MDPKEERYDPGINIDSDSSDDGELNNAKAVSCSPTADTLGDVLVHNDFGLSRKGPQANGECKNFRCPNKGTPAGQATHDGGHYSCSERVPRQENWGATHRFCDRCAHLGQCPLDRSPHRDGLVASEL